MFFSTFLLVLAWSTYSLISLPSIFSLWCQLDYAMWLWTQYYVMVNSLIFKCPKLNDKTNKIPHCWNNFKYQNRKKRGQIDTVNTQIMTADFSVFRTGTSMKSDEAKLALLARNILIWTYVGDVKHHNLDNLSG